MFTMLRWETENSVEEKQQYAKTMNRNIKQMQTQKQLRPNIMWWQGLVLSFLLKFPQNFSHVITVSRNLVGISFPIAHQITGQADFSWKHFVKTLTWRHIMQIIPWCCKL